MAQVESTFQTTLVLQKKKNHKIKQQQQIYKNFCFSFSPSLFLSVSLFISLSLSLSLSLFSPIHTQIKHMCTHKYLKKGKYISFYSHHGNFDTKNDTKGTIEIETFLCMFLLDYLLTYICV
jgi:hypothetical protein